jgi:hypothetical protein
MRRCMVFSTSNEVRKALEAVIEESHHADHVLKERPGDVQARVDSTDQGQSQ